MTAPIKPTFRIKWDYWRWLFLGLTSKPGVLKFVDWWLPFHVFVATQLAIRLDDSIKDQATTIVLPLAGALVGLTFAWSGNAQALMQADSLNKMFSKHSDGLKNYLYTFQTAVLCVLVDLVGWGLAGLGLFDSADHSSSHFDFCIKSILYFVSSLSVRECWHVIFGSQYLTLAQQSIKDHSDA